MINVSLFGDWFYDNSEFAKEVGEDYINRYHIKVETLDNIPLIYSKLADKWLEIYHYVDPKHLTFIVNSLYHTPNNNISDVALENEATLAKINKIVKKPIDTQLSLF